MRKGKFASLVLSASPLVPGGVALTAIPAVAAPAETGVQAVKSAWFCVWSPEGYSNVRSGPGMKYRRIFKLYDGDCVNTVGRSGNWYKLERGGWINKAQLY